MPRDSRGFTLLHISITRRVCACVGFVAYEEQYFAYSASVNLVVVVAVVIVAQNESFEWYMWCMKVIQWQSDTHAHTFTLAALAAAIPVNDDNDDDDDHNNNNSTESANTKIERRQMEKGDYTENEIQNTRPENCVIYGISNPCALYARKPYSIRIAIFISNCQRWLRY